MLPRRPWGASYGDFDEVEPTTLVRDAAPIVAIARARPRSGRGGPPSVDEAAIVARMIRELEPLRGAAPRAAPRPGAYAWTRTGPRPKALPLLPNVFLTPRRVGDPLPPWELPWSFPPAPAREARPRTHEAREARDARPRRTTRRERGGGARPRRSILPLVMFLAFGALAFGVTYDPVARADATTNLMRARAYVLALGQIGAGWLR